MGSVVRRFLRYRIVSIVFLVGLFALVVAIVLPLFSWGHADGRQYVFPNGDIYYNRGDIDSADAEYLVEQFAENPAEFRASGGGSIKIRVVEIHRGWRFRKNLFTGRTAWHLTAVTTYITDLEIVIEEDEVKDTRVLESRPTQPGPTGTREGTRRRTPER